MKRMTRTQIYLDPNLSQALERLARKRGTSKAEVIRLAARRFLSQEEPNEAAEDPILGLIGIGGDRDAPTDLSVRHDHYLTEMQLEEMREFRKRQR